MAVYSVALTTWANTSVEVEVPDDVTDPERIAELAVEHNDPPTLCNQCSGGGRSGHQELELGDDWQAVTFQDQAVVTRLG
ncbi:hypothetical protein [Kitasatospora azatica]|uniref:hypothetical protein n=1 Tax=Kitasatospora azatica TaxID=58347 RepID=UPI0005622799|nr:hypothetical protein [Kitasatospora azatica]